MNKYSIIKHRDFEKAMESFKESGENGLAILGVGGDVDEWIEGITSLIHSEDIWPTENPNNYFSSFHIINAYSNNNATVLCMVFADTAELNLPALATWRLRNTAQYNLMWIQDLVDMVL